MARAYNSTSRLLLNPITTQLPSSRNHARILNLAVHSKHQTQDSSPSRSLKKFEVSQNSKKKKKAARAPRSLVSISTSGRGWEGEWSCHFALTLRELQLADLAEDGHKDADVLVNLLIQKHAGFGLSIDGRIVTSFNRKCSCCASSYCRKIDTHFDVWILSSSRNSDNHLPEIGGTDPSVIYVKPGYEADLDSLIQDTIRLTTIAEDTCSESCSKSTIVWEFTDGKKHYDRRWSRLLELKNAVQKMPS